MAATTEAAMVATTEAAAEDAPTPYKCLRCSHNVFFTVHTGNLYNSFALEGFNQDYCVETHTGESYNQHILRAIRMVDLKEWFKLNGVLDVNIRKWFPNANALSNKACTIVRSMLAEMLKLAKNRKFHGDVLKMENWIIDPQSLQVELVSSQNFQSTPRTQKFERLFEIDLADFLTVIENFLDLNIIRYSPEIQNFFNTLKMQKNPYNYFMFNEHTILDNVTFWGWERRRMYIIDLALHCKTMSQVDQYKLKNIFTLSSSKNWQHKVYLTFPSDSPLRLVFAAHQNGYRNNSFGLLRYHRDVLEHIHDPPAKETPRQWSGKYIEKEEDKFWDKQYAEYTLFMTFPNFFMQINATFPQLLHAN